MKIEIDLEEIADAVADRVRSKVLRMLGEAVSVPPGIYDIVLTDAGEKKIEVIKEVRAITGLGLKEAKDLVEGAPQNVAEAASRANTTEIKARLERVGATVELVNLSY